MKKIEFILMIALTTLTILYGCRKQEMVQKEKIPSIPHGNQEVSVSFPEGMNVKFTDYSLFSLADDSRLDASGNSTVSYNQGHTNIAWLFDKDNNIVMAGFVNDTAKAINAASTAKVLLYYALGIPMLPKEMTDGYVNEINSIQGVTDWINTFTVLLKKDRLVLSKGGHLEALKTAVLSMSGDNNNYSAFNSTGDDRLMAVSQPNLIAVKKADINVYGGVKSGLQVSSKELSKVLITNNYRRRAHAFFYKTKFKDLAGVEKGVISEINETTPSDKDQSLDPTDAINSFTGVVGSWIEGKAMDFAAKEGGPFDFPLQDNESEATYKVRIVGPGIWAPGKKLTNAEKTTLYKLEVKTLTFDFLIPLLASTITKKIDAKPVDAATESEKETFNDLLQAAQTIVEEMIKGSPGVYEEMQKGNYKEALTKLLESAYAGNANAGKEGFVKVMAILARMAVQQKYYVSPQYDEVLAQNRMMKILEFTDKILEGTDYAHIVFNLMASQHMDEWELLLRSGTVTLQFLPGYDSLLNTAEETKIKAEIKNMAESDGDQHPFFEWSTTGNYGKLVDTKGHSGSSFETADAIISYQSTTNSSQLKEGDNIDYIYAKALFNNVVIGTDTIAVNVKRIDYEMKPEDAVVTGKDHADAAKTATLFLQKTDGKRDIPNSNIYDFKIEWSTTGSYGQLEGATTTYNDDDIVYKATSKQDGIFNETVTARIYVKPKGENAAYSFYGQDKVTVKIDNDPKKRIIWKPMQLFHGDDTSGSLYKNCIKYAGVNFAPDPNAKSYELKFLGVITIIGAQTHLSWNAGKPSPAPLAPSIGASEYSVYYYYTVRSAPYNLQHADEPSLSGGARITIYLK